ncbi:MAG: DNA gyrase inhibitor YacG [Myxococcales bacterium]|nr:DNA gyrase inhibitor YacG [Myxococcales bacterium]
MRACPICRRTFEVTPESRPHAPFCSARCKTIDLGNWLGEGYRLGPEAPVVPAPGSDERPS